MSENTLAKYQKIFKMHQKCQKILGGENIKELQETRILGRQAAPYSRCSLRSHFTPTNLVPAWRQVEVALTFWPTRTDTHIHRYTDTQNAQLYIQIVMPYIPFKLSFLHFGTFTTPKSSSGFKPALSSRLRKATSENL